jgi:ubiquinone/menaquinone biosynthesis C-methylase UbiE
MDCDKIARPYRWIEYLAFGRKLERHRFHFLSAIGRSRNALLLGDGDGRFAAALAASNRSVQIDSIESSANMIRAAKRRLRKKPISNPGRIHFIQADALHATLQPDRYDLVVTNFFFDCFSTKQAVRLIEAVSPACRCGALWLISDFRQPAKGWRALHAKIWLRIMYLFFRLTTHLETSRLPSYEKALQSAGFALESSYYSMAGLICSERWLLTERHPSGL